MFIWIHSAHKWAIQIWFTPIEVFKSFYTEGHTFGKERLTILGNGDISWMYKYFFFHLQKSNFLSQWCSNSLASTRRQSITWNNVLSIDAYICILYRFCCILAGSHIILHEFEEDTFVIFFTVWNHVLKRPRKIKSAMLKMYL